MTSVFLTDMYITTLTISTSLVLYLYINIWKIKWMNEWNFPVKSDSTVQKFLLMVYIQKQRPVRLCETKEKYRSWVGDKSNFFFLRSLPGSYCHADRRVYSPTEGLFKTSPLVSTQIITQDLRDLCSIHFVTEKFYDKLLRNFNFG